MIKSKSGKMEKSVQITLIIVIGVIVLVLASTNFSNPSKNTITVSGQATIEVMPDIVSIYFNVDTQGSTANEAGDKNSEIVRDLIAALAALGFEEEEIQTQSYNIYPEYDYVVPRSNIIGYRATHSLRVEVPANQSARIGAVVDAGLDSGAGIGYINFELSQENQNKYKAEAMKLAAQDATSKAEGVAEGLGKTLGSLVSVSIDNYDYYPWLARDFSGVAAAEAKEAATSIVPTDQQISATVTAVFKIR